MLGLDSDTQNSYFGLMLRDLGKFFITIIVYFPIEYVKETKYSLRYARVRSMRYKSASGKDIN